MEEKQTSKRPLVKAEVPEENQVVFERATEVIGDRAEANCWLGT